MFWEYKCDPSGELLSFIKKICSVVTHSRYVKRLLAPVFLKIARNPFHMASAAGGRMYVVETDRKKRKG